MLGDGTSLRSGEEACVMAVVKESLMAGVRGEVKPFSRMAIRRGKGLMDPILLG